MNTSLDGKVAIVTGAATGLGATTALRLAHDGAKVVLTHLPGQENDVEALLATAGDAADRLAPIGADIGDPAGLASLFDAAEDRFAGLDILVNNAVLAILKPIAEVTRAEFEAAFRVNAQAPFFAMQLAGERMRDGGRVINISSHTTGLFFPNYGLYDGTKGALEQFSRVFSREIGHRGITVNTVSPGPTDTPAFSTRPKEFIDGLKKMTALGRIGTTDEIVNAIAFLAGDQSGWITGQNIRVNGGAV